MRHSRTAFWTLITDYNHIAWLNFISNHCLPGLILRVIAACRTSECPSFRFHCTEFHNSTVRSNISMQNRQAPMFVNRNCYTVNHICVSVFSLFCLLFYGAEHSFNLSVYLLRLQKFFHNSTDSSRLLEFFHCVGRVIGINRTNYRNFSADLIKFLRQNINSDLISNGRNMKKTVGRSSCRHHVAHYIFKTLFCNKFTRAFFLFHCLCNRSSCLTGHTVPFFALASNTGVSVRRQSQKLCHGTHSIGSPHKRTGSGSGTCIFNYLFIFLPAHLPGSICGIGLLGMGQRKHPTVQFSRSHISTSKHNSRNIHPQSPHHHTRNHFIAGSKKYHPFQHIQLCNRFYLCRHQIPGRKCIPVSRRVRANPIADS